MHNYTVDVQMTLGKLTNQIQKDMENSDRRYSFAVPPMSGHSTPPALLPMGLVSKGQRRPSDGTVRMRVEYLSPTTTLSTMMHKVNRWKFQGVEGLNIAEGYWQLFFSKSAKTFVEPD